MSFRTLSLLFLLFPALPARAQAEATSLEAFVNNSKTPEPGTEITVPYDSTSLRFLIQAHSKPVRYKLENLEHDWQEKPGEMNFLVRFIKANGDQVSQKTFPVTGRSPGWNGSVLKSEFIPRSEILTVPPEAEYIGVTISSAGPAVAIGVFAIKDISVTSVEQDADVRRSFLTDSLIPGTRQSSWVKGGTHPSMASAINLESGGHDSPVLLIEDDDITAHADWATGIYSLPKVTPGEQLLVRWKEAYNAGMGGTFSINYERVPPGSYRFIVEDLSLAGQPLKHFSGISAKVPRPYWTNPWFWIGCALTAALIITLISRHLIRKKINRHLRHAQIIADERLRIARDLHDDLGTRLSHISLLGSYAESTIPDAEARETFRQITAMSRELISALSETVWMLNSKNNKLESLVNFLCRLVSELCKLSNIRCRIDATPAIDNISISHEIRHNVSLSVKESVNNALKHACATEIRMKISLEGLILKISVADNGIGIASGSHERGTGLESIIQRMASIKGRSSVDELEEGGIRVSLEVPIG